MNNELILEVGRSIEDSSVRFSEEKQVRFHRILAAANWGQKLAEPALAHYAKLVRLQRLTMTSGNILKLHMQRNGLRQMKPVYDLARKQPFTNSQMALLIGYQAHANARDKKGERAAMLALEAGRLDAVQHKSPRLYARWAAEAKLDHSIIERI